MNDSAPPTATLLSLTAPTRRESRTTAPEPGFAEKLDAAERPVETNRPPQSSSDDAPPATEPPVETHTATTKSTETSESDKKTPPEEPVSEDDLLVVSVAVETLVLETPPDAQLPAEASTSLDVSIENPIEVTAPDATLDPTLGSANPLAAALLVEGEAGTPQLDTLGVADDASIDPLAQLTTDTTDAALATSVAQSTASLQDEAASEGEGDVTQPSFGTETTGSAADTEANPNSIELSSQGLTERSELTTTNKEANSTDAETPSPERAGPLPQSTVSSTVETATDLAEPTTDRSAPPTVGTATETRAATANAAAEKAAIESTPTVDPSRFVSRVARAFGLAQERGGPIEIRLSPPELGSLQVRIEMKEGVMTASLDVETPAARNALLDNLPALRDRLEQQQIRLEKFDVDVRDDSGQRGDDWQPRGNSDGRPDERAERRQPNPNASTDRTTKSEETEPRTVSTIDFGDDAINVVA